jgi:hypothetical protein
MSVTHKDGLTDCVKTKLRVLSPRANILIKIPSLVGEVCAKCADKVCRVVTAADPYGRNLRFLHCSRYFLFQVVSQLYSRAEWTPFPTHYFSESLVASGIGPGPLDL